MSYHNSIIAVEFEGLNDVECGEGPCDALIGGLLRYKFSVKKKGNIPFDSLECLTFKGRHILNEYSCSLFEVNHET